MLKSDFPRKSGSEKPMASTDTGGGKALAAMIAEFLFRERKHLMPTQHDSRQEHQLTKLQLNKYKEYNIKILV